jgi:DedD protein
MEKKKLLLVAISVGVVLLIIIGIPLMMIVPKQHYAAQVDVNHDWVTTVEPNSVQRPQPPVEPVLEPQISKNTQPNENVFRQPEASPSVTTLTIPIPETVAVPNTPITQAQKPAAVKIAPVSKPAPSAAQTAKAPAKPVSASKPAAVKVVAKKPEADTKYSNYWVQTGAFSTKIRAEGAKESLESKGITSIIDNRDIDGKTWYRVRVGPYTSETEANYWLALVKSIDGFGESQIRLTQVQ